MKKTPAYRTRPRKNGPVTLSPAEMENPYKVIKDFFAAYTLTDIRIFLREKEYELIDAAGAPALIRRLEKFVEAAWVFHKKTEH